MCATIPSNYDYQVSERLQERFFEMLQALERNLEAPCSERRLEHEISNRGELCLLRLISPLATGQWKPPQHERPSHTLTRTLQAMELAGTPPHVATLDHKDATTNHERYAPEDARTYCSLQLCSVVVCVGTHIGILALWDCTRLQRIWRAGS